MTQCRNVWNCEKTDLWLDEMVDWELQNNYLPAVHSGHLSTNIIWFPSSTLCCEDRSFHKHHLLHHNLLTSLAVHYLLWRQIYPHITWFYPPSLSLWKMISGLDLCEGGRFSTAIFHSDIQLSVCHFVKGNVCWKFAHFFCLVHDKGWD